MRNTLSTTWVKNVYSQRMGHGTTSGVLSPIHSLPSITHDFVVGQLSLILQNTPRFTQALSTSFNRLFYLLSATYTHNPQPLLLEPIKKI